jgi:NTE family protein
VSSLRHSNAGSVRPSTADDAGGGIALVLGAGGTKGWAHVGVIKVLREAGIPIDLVVGASAGALVGALYAARGDAVAAERLAMTFTPNDFLEWSLSDLRLSPRGGRMGRRLWQHCGRLDFQEMNVPFAAMALDISTGRPVVLRDGNVGHAVEASIRPLIFGRPVERDDLHLVDGGFHDTVPVNAAREMGAEMVISVNVGEFIMLPGPLGSLSARVGAAYRSRSAGHADIGGQIGLLATLMGRERLERVPADVEIRPDMRGISPMWPWHIQRAMRRGEAAAREALPSIRRLLAERPPAL